MPVTVEVTNGHFLPELTDALTRSGCRTEAATAQALRVEHPAATTKNEALLEVAFFVRAWQLRYPGVSARVSA